MWYRGGDSERERLRLPRSFSGLERPFRFFFRWDLSTSEGESCRGEPGTVVVVVVVVTVIVLLMA